jgi:hypothetical protein
MIKDRTKNENVILNAPALSLPANASMAREESLARHCASFHRRDSSSLLLAPFGKGISVRQKELRMTWLGINFV